MISFNCHSFFLFLTISVDMSTGATWLHDKTLSSNNHQILCCLERVWSFWHIFQAIFLTSVHQWIISKAVYLPLLCIDRISTGTMTVPASSWPSGSSIDTCYLGENSIAYGGSCRRVPCVHMAARAAHVAVKQALATHWHSLQSRTGGGLGVTGWARAESVQKVHS